MASKPVIEVEGLRKTYPGTVALDGVSFEVLEGEIFGLIGPNGAGKTTTMECVEGIRASDGGSISVFSLDPMRDANALINRIGVQLQAAELQKRIRVGEAVDLWASLYPRTVDAGELLDQLGLSEKVGAKFMTLSGGQKQRLFIALALINDPELVFLDELTTGLDPQARRKIWGLVRSMKDRGKTVFLTTHLMEEAERLCDRVAIIEHGAIVDIDTPDALVARHCPERRVILTVVGAADLEPFTRRGWLESGPDENGRITLSGQGDDFVSSVIQCLAEANIRVGDFRTEQPNLEDVFLRLTGHSIRD